MAAVRAVCVMRGEGAVQGVIHFEQQVRARPGRRDPPRRVRSPPDLPLQPPPREQRGGRDPRRARLGGAAVPNGRGPWDLRRPLWPAREPRGHWRSPVRDLSGRPHRITGTPCA